MDLYSGIGESMQKVYGLGYKAKGQEVTRDWKSKLFEQKQKSKDDNLNFAFQLFSLGHDIYKDISQSKRTSRFAEQQGYKKEGSALDFLLGTRKYYKENELDPSFIGPSRPGLTSEEMEMKRSINLFQQTLKENQYSEDDMALFNTIKGLME